MAGTVTHAYFAKAVVKEVEKERKIIYDNNYLYIFSQSMDPFNFYSVLFPIKPKSSDKRKFSNIFHCTKTDEFFYTLINYIKKNKLYRDKMVMSFLYGFITHYVLDSSLHPYVEYKTGKFHYKDKTSYKYNAKHHEMESYLDQYILEKNDIIPQKYKSYDIFFNIHKFNKSLISVIDYSFFQVYKFKNFSKHYFKAIKDMKFCFRVLRYDPFGYKKYFYKVFDLISTKKVLNSKFLSYSYTPKKAKEYLNLDHKTWNYPYNNKIKLNYSFDDIYNNSINKCTHLIIKVTDYIEKNKPIDINSLFSLSYVTGIDWKLKNDNPIYEF